MFRYVKKWPWFFAFILTLLLQYDDCMQRKNLNNQYKLVQYKSTLIYFIVHYCRDASCVLFAWYLLCFFLNFPLFRWIYIRTLYVYIYIIVQRTYSGLFPLVWLFGKTHLCSFQSFYPFLFLFALIFYTYCWYLQCSQEIGSLVRTQPFPRRCRIKYCIIYTKNLTFIKQINS